MINEYDESRERGWSGMNPDSAMTNFGDADRFTAFIWVYDKKSGKSLLYSQPGDKFHGTGTGEKQYGGTELRKSLLFKKREAVVCFGRFGVTNKGGFVTIWKYQEEEPLTHYDVTREKEDNRGFSSPNKEEIKILLKGLLGQAPIKIIGKTPAKLPITTDYVFVVGGNAQTVGEFVGDTGQQQDPRCKAMTIDIQGRPTPLDQIQASMHMVRGQQLALLRGGFCSQYQALKNSAATAHCQIQHRQIDDIQSKFKCGNNQDEYQKMLQAGKADYKQKLRDIFHSPDKIGQEFRTQKEIDAAWDKLQGENFSFKEWLNSLAVPSKP
jgi:hypothetical protein